MDPETTGQPPAQPKQPFRQAGSLVHRFRRWRNPAHESLRSYLEPPTGHSLEDAGEPLEFKRQPPRTDPRHADQSIPVGQDDIPAGGTSGEEMRGGGKHPAG